MKNQKLLTVLTVANLTLLLFQVARFWPAKAEGVASVLRASALEIVDVHGKVRASLAIYPANPKVKTPDGGTLGETVMLRLINPNGRPAVKLATSEQGAGLALSGDSGLAYALLQGKTTGGSLKLVDKDGKQKLIEQ